MVYCSESDIDIHVRVIFSVALGVCLFTCLLEGGHLSFWFFASFVYWLVRAGFPLPIFVDGLRRLGYSQLSSTLSRQCCLTHNYFAH